MVSNLPPAIKVGVVNVSVAGCKIELFEQASYQPYLSNAAPWMKNIVKNYGGDPYQYLVENAKLSRPAMPSTPSSSRQRIGRYPAPRVV